MIRPEEVVVVVYRRGPEFLVALRSPERDGYWNLVAGGVEEGEEPAAAARRELVEESRSREPGRFERIPLELGYVRPEGTRVALYAFLAEAPLGFEPVLDEEHVEYRWCSVGGGGRAPRVPRAREAVAYATRSSSRSGVRVGVDTSPLVQTRAGTARHVRGLLGALRDRPGLDLELLSFGGPGRASSVDARRALVPGRPRAGAPVRSTSSTARRSAGRSARRSPDGAHRARPRDPPLRPRRSRAGTGCTARPGSFACCGPRTRSSPSPSSRGDETVELAGVPAERIRVVPHGVDAVFTPDGPAADGDYVLAVATLEPRKNLARVVEAAREAGVELRVVGARGWGGVEVDGWVGEIPDAELAALYRGARCVLYPSLYEGFGLPVLEAMACGTPVVTSRRDGDGGGRRRRCGSRRSARRRRRSRRGSARPSARRDELVAARARARAASSPGSAPPTRSLGSGTELA